MPLTKMSSSVQRLLAYSAFTIQIHKCPVRSARLNLNHLMRPHHERKAVEEELFKNLFRSKRFETSYMRYMAFANAVAWYQHVITRCSGHQQLISASFSPQASYHFHKAAVLLYNTHKYYSVFIRDSCRVICISVMAHFVYNIH